MTNEVKIKLGAVLKSERERRNITIEKLSEQLKISIDNLTAIESGDPASITSDLYFGLFTKSYAEAVGIDYSRTIEAINDEILDKIAAKKVESAENSKKKKNDSESDNNEEGFSIKKIAYFFGIVIGVFVIFLVVNMLFFKSDEPLVNESGQSGTTAVKLSSEEIDHSLYADYNWDNIAYPQAEKLSMTLTPIRDSWSTILADGDTVVYRILRVGRVYNVEADYRLLISIGIPTAVEIVLNGQKVDLRNPESKRISRVAIDQNNISKFLYKEKDETSSKDVPAPLTNQDNSVKIKIVESAADSLKSTDTITDETQTTE